MTSERSAHRAATFSNFEAGNLPTESALAEKLYRYFGGWGARQRTEAATPVHLFPVPVHCSPQPKSFMHKRILIVDDSAHIRGLLKLVIETRAGLKVCGEAVDGLEGIAKGFELEPDAINLDYSMP